MQAHTAQGHNCWSVGAHEWSGLTALSYLNIAGTTEALFSMLTWRSCRPDTPQASPASKAPPLAKHHHPVFIYLSGAREAAKAGSASGTALFVLTAARPPRVIQEGAATGKSIP